MIPDRTGHQDYFRGLGDRGRQPTPQEATVAARWVFGVLLAMIIISFVVAAIMTTRAAVRPAPADSPALALDVGPAS